MPPAGWTPIACRRARKPGAKRVCGSPRPMKPSPRSGDLPLPSLTYGATAPITRGGDGMADRLPKRRGRLAAAAVRGPAGDDGLRAVAHAAGDAARDRREDRHLDDEGELGRRSRPRRGEGGAGGGRRLPTRAGTLRAPRRARAEGDSPLRPARHGEDAAREGDRERGWREVLH